MDEKESKIQEAEKYAQLDALTQHKGWQILLKHLEQVKQSVIKGLIEEKDPKEVNILQERYRAFDSVIATIQSAKEIKERLYQDVQEIIEDEQLKEEFDF